MPKTKEPAKPATKKPAAPKRGQNGNQPDTGKGSQWRKDAAAKAVATKKARQGRPITDREIAKSVGVDLKTVRKILAESQRRIVEES